MLVLKKHLEVNLCTKALISITNTTWEIFLYLPVCLRGGGDPPWSMLGNGNVQMEKTNEQKNQFLSSWINKYYPERLSDVAEIMCLGQELSWSLVLYTHYLSFFKAYLFALPALRGLITSSCCCWVTIVSPSFILVLTAGQ